MVSISRSREIAAPVDRVWEIVADIDNEPKFWHGTKSVNNISKNGNVIEREVTIAFRDSRCKQTVILDPKKSVEIKFTEGPMRGTKKIVLGPLGGKTRLEVSWEIKLAGFLSLASGMVKRHIADGTEEALDRIAKAVE
jgi:carbon monoxide dehydrogenase subunit G